MSKNIFDMDEPQDDILQPDVPYTAGDIIYSPAHLSYLIITRVDSDNDWWFVIEDQPGRLEQKASIALSKLRNERRGQ